MLLFKFYEDWKVIQVWYTQIIIAVIELHIPWRFGCAEYFLALFSPLLSYHTPLVLDACDDYESERRYGVGKSGLVKPSFQARISTSGRGLGVCANGEFPPLES